jgi:hypothetical protein
MYKDRRQTARDALMTAKIGEAVGPVLGNDANLLMLEKKPPIKTIDKTPNTGRQKKEK